MTNLPNMPAAGTITTPAPAGATSLHEPPHAPHSPQPSPHRPPPTTPPAATRRRKFRFRITAEGFMLLLIMILVGFSAWHSGTNLLYLVFSILVAVYLLHGFVLSINLSRLTITENLPSMAVAHQPFDVTITAQNNKRWVSSHSIRISHTAAQSRNPIGVVHFLQVPPGAQARQTYSAIIDRRGYFHITTATVATRYPFGFEERAQIHARALTVLVLPQTYPVAAIAAQVPTGFGDQESTVRGSGTDLYGLREYVQGEPARHVHWRTSARAQKLMIAEYTREERRQTILLLDNAAPPRQQPQLRDPFENAITLTASLARHLMESGYEVGLTTQDVQIQPGQGNSRLTEILRALAVIQLTDAKPLSPSLPGLQITYQNTATPPQTPHRLTIDSTAWQPPHQNALAGEKYL